MVHNILNFLGKSKFYSSLVCYEIPERYRNSFYLANGALFDQVNWYLHKAYETYFPKLVSFLKDKEPILSDTEAVEKVTTVIKILDQCNSIIDIRFPVLLDNGKKEIVRGFRAQYGLFSGFHTSLGGLRITEDVTRDHIKGLAALSSYKNACMGIRLAGGHGGIRINPKNYSETEMQRIVKKYAGELYMKGFCDGNTDIIEPDINVGEREMAWIASIFSDDYEKTMVAGKPVELGGIENYVNMTSQGIFFALDYFINDDTILEKIGMAKGGLKKKTFIIQGLGKLGASLAKFLENNGAVCVGIKECDGYIYDPKGIDIQDVAKYKSEHGSIQNFRNAKPKVNDDVFKEQCDILILAAQQKSLICYVADKVKAKIIIEAANGALTPTSHKILVGHSKLVLPDIYISSGHAVASYLEYLYSLKRNGMEFPVIRPLYRHILDVLDVKKTSQIVSSTTTQKIVSCEMKPDLLTYAIDHVMRETGHDLMEIAKEFNLGMDIRIAGYIKAIESIHDSIYKLKNY